MSLETHPYIEANQTRQDRIDKTSAKGELCVSLIDLLISATLKFLAWFDPLWYIVFWICRIFIWEWGESCWREKGALLAWFPGPQISFWRINWAFISTPSTALAPLSARWEAQSECLAFHPLFSEPTPSLEALKVPARILTEVNMQVAVFCLKCLVSSGENCQPPSLLSQWWKGNKCTMRSLGYESCSDQFALGGCLGRSVWQRGV